MLNGLQLTALLLVGAAISVSPLHAQPKKVEISKNITLEVDGATRRVLVNTTVCLRQGQLEQLLTRKRTKEHEAILVADIDARELHKALLLAGAEPGSPVKFQPKFVAPSGTAVKVSVEYKANGKTIRRPAQDWLRNIKTQKPLEADWVFAGSRLFKDPMNPNAAPYYLANDGDIVCIANFDTALLDVPFVSTMDNDHLTFEANTDLIPPLEASVTLILEPVRAKK